MRLGRIAAWVVCGSIAAGTARALPVSTSDLFDIGQGAAVLSNSPVHGISLPGNMLGGSGGIAETEHLLFDDGYPAGQVHWIDWSTPAAVAVTSFNLVAIHDPGYAGRDANERGFSRFTLSAWVGSSWQLLYDHAPSNPYGGGVTYPDSNYLELNATVATTTASVFRAEYTQYGDRTPGATGPRVVELDGYGSVVPEPTILALLAASAGLFALRRGRNSRGASARR